ncbi:AMP-binding protein [Steroidobacter sp.]|uniref:AMP-binding protein n=1 Tax=Steroidobacter sp. TaxID=1978227 RepID=UPI001A3CDF33|nr:AMP-binding protein [Steroidobacter sp.]MBL8264780.1 AMP-binding protein [Steroidobacter sp.]
MADSRLPLGALPRYYAERKPPSALALVHPEGALTWSQLEARANQRARLYRSLGVGPGDYVSLALGNGNAFYETTFAVWKLGAIPNVISSRLPAGEAGEILQLVKPKLLVAESVEILQLMRPKDCACIAADADLSGFDDSTVEDAEPAPQWKAMTSGGSTGRPKIIVDRKPALHDPSEVIFEQRAGGVVLNPGPLYHNAPFMLTHLALFNGSTVVGMRRFDAEEALQLIERHLVDWVNFVPTMMHRIWALPESVRKRYDLSSLRAVWHMAAPMPEWLKQFWLDWLGADKLWELYGGTERQGLTTINGVEWLKRRGSVGRLVTPGGMKALREDGSDCDADEVGEIYFLPTDGPGSTYYYLGADAKRRPDGWESLGDIGRIDADGYLYLADRRVDLIVRGGANIYPAEVEAALDAHPAVASSVAIGLPDAELGRVVHALVQPRPNSQLDVAELHSFLATKLGRYKLPCSYELSASPLRDDAGKVRRTALRDEREAWLTQGRVFRLFPPV